MDAARVSGAVGCAGQWCLRGVSPFLCLLFLVLPLSRVPGTAGNESLVREPECLLPCVHLCRGVCMVLGFLTGR